MARDGMAGNYFRRSGYVNLGDMPDSKNEYVLNFENLTGGMNTFDLDFELKPNESPLIRNLSWDNGVLCSRRGQVQVGDLGRSGVQCCYEQLWHGWMIVQVDKSVIGYKMRIEVDEAIEQPVGTIKRIMNWDALRDNPGTFAAYRDVLLFKCRGFYRRFVYNDETDTITSKEIDGGPANTYVPIIQINTDPETAGGDSYQPINRLSRYKKVQYNAKWKIDPETGETAVDQQGNKVPVDTYVFPIADVEGVYHVKINGVVLPRIVDEETSATSWRWDKSLNAVVFKPGYVPTPTDPPSNNTVEITIIKKDDDAFNSIVNCSRMAVFGGAQNLCVVMGGCEAQPNAYFWSGNNTVIMDPTYFPMNQYNLAGNTDEIITGFGKQQNMLVIFQPHSVGRATFGTTELSDRAQITMDYVRINSEIGCDLPRSIQLVDNNLVWCSRRDGVCYLKDSSSAYENNIVRISQKVDGNYRHAGLLAMVKGAPDESVWSLDTGTKYVLGYNGQAYEWNYELSTYQNPSWFSHTGIQGIAFVADLDHLWELTPSGVVAEFQRIFADFGAGIDKVYVLPPRNFGSYDRLKNIMSVIFTTRGDYYTNTQIEYVCDYGVRIDPTPLVSRSLWSLVPRDLSHRDLSCQAFAFVARRKPGYHNIRHLRIKLYNNAPGADLSIVSAQIFYTFRGRQR